MKYFASVLLALISITAFSQENEPTSAIHSVPDFIDSPMYLSNDGVLISMEKQVATLRRIDKFFSVEAYYDVKNQNSSLVIYGTDTVYFVIRLGSSDIPPDNITSLYSWKEENDFRTKKLLTQGTLSASVKTGDEKIPFSFERFADRTYKLGVKGLAPGHYGFSTKEATFLFDVK